jgi:hypothetical protein
VPPTVHAIEYAAQLRPAPWLRRRAKGSARGTGTRPELIFPKGYLVKGIALRRFATAGSRHARPKKFASGMAKPDSNYVGNQTECSGTIVQLRRVTFPHSHRARGSRAANIQADADMYTFSSHDRDAMPEMRRADETGFDRATRRQLQPADLSLCTLRLRRELFEGDLDRRYAVPELYQQVKAVLAKGSGRKDSGKKALVGKAIPWPSARMPSGKSRLPKPATQSGMPQRRPAR